MRPLRGLHVVITGASAGLGAELARQLAPHGCRLTLAARRAGLLEQVAQAAQAAGAASVAVPTDVTEETQVQALAVAARQRFGEIDVWVNNAGSGLRQRLLDTSDGQLLALHRLHVLAPLWAYRAVVPAWLAAGHAGQLVDVCSLGGKAGYPFNGAYAAAKHGLSALGDTLRHELYGTGVAVTTVYPGPTVTGFGQASPDLTGGASAAHVGGARASRNRLVRAVATPQAAATVAAALVRAIQTRQPVVYPHRWATLAALLQNLWPSLALRLANRGGGAKPGG
jgi:short-subunit dehydrogenase